MHHNVKAYKDAVMEMCAILAVIDPVTQGAVLADLFAMYLAGHMGEDREEARAEVISLWLETVRDLVPIHERMFLEKIRARAN